MKNIILKNIIKNIILAQIASDAGKGIYNKEFFSPSLIKKEVKTAWRLGYAVKDKYILNAIKIISTTPRCGINFWCVKAPDQNDYDSIITYFDIKTNEKRYQVSFHSPYNRTHIKALQKKGRPTRWTYQVKGSREACLELFNLFK